MSNSMSDTKDLDISALKVPGLTNGEYAEAIELDLFLQWMQDECIPPAEDNADRAHIVGRWLKAKRKATAERIKGR